VGSEGCGDEEFAVGEIHDARHAVLERKPHSRKRVHTAEDQPGENDVDQECHCAALLRAEEKDSWAAPKVRPSLRSIRTPVSTPASAAPAA
jgi:hypothetical protein